MANSELNATCVGLASCFAFSSRLITHMARLQTLQQYHFKASTILKIISGYSPWSHQEASQCQRFTSRKVTACLPGLVRAWVLVPVVLQLASRRKAVWRRGWKSFFWRAHKVWEFGATCTSMARAARSWRRCSSTWSSLERRLARATNPAWLHTPSWKEGPVKNGS